MQITSRNIILIKRNGEVVVLATHGVDGVVDITDLHMVEHGVIVDDSAVVGSVAEDDSGDSIQDGTGEVDGGTGTDIDGHRGIMVVIQDTGHTPGRDTKPKIFFNSF